MGSMGGECRGDCYASTSMPRTAPPASAAAVAALLASALVLVLVVTPHDGDEAAATFGPADDQVVPAWTMDRAEQLRAAKPAVPRPASRPAASRSRARAPAPGGGAGGALACLRRYESGGNYRTDSGNGFYGAYQFDARTWRSVGGSGNPAAASPAEQDARAAELARRRGYQPWPVTSHICGLR